MNNNYFSDNQEDEEFPIVDALVNCVPCIKQRILLSPQKAAVFFHRLCT
ncbi:MAG: hypothetical protein RSE31_07545 [Anaerovoracaceae bacterium]